MLIKAFTVQIRATGSSFRETQTILRLFGVRRSHQAIFVSTSNSYSAPDSHRAKPNRVAVDETVAKINGE